MLFKKIKLAGFKSFVDPTTLNFRSRLVGIVGPNGCGKSNVIDAVRWVMGESSAKTLRGESMADVIFNGSSTRQPIGQAAVELVFDNADGSVKGEYASYAEISVRREVTRDGQSHYFLNNTRCRKRDIVDVFLGTGLGPRSYSIIEQGMISRIVEAKPEDLRAFFEEAAGISLYKKRRHETNIRMRHTRDNLIRIADICREQELQLEKLQKQSAAASKYQELQKEKAKVEQELLLLRWRDYDGQLQIASEQIRTLATQLEEKLANRTTIDTKLEKLRLEYVEKTDQFNEIQTSFYDLGANIARREQTLQHHQERIQQLQADLAENKQREVEVCGELAKDKVDLTNLKKEASIIEPNYEQAAKELATEERLSKNAQHAMHEWLEKSHNLQEQAHKLQKKSEVEKITIEQLEKQSKEYQMRLDRLKQEQDSLDVTSSEQTLHKLTNEFVTIEQHEQDLKHSLDKVITAGLTLREDLKQQQRQVDNIRGEIQILRGRQASLETLQQAALGKENHQAVAWLQEQGLTELPRVAEQIQVATGWERAVEVVLGKYLEYICVENNFEELIANIPDLLELNLGLLNTNTKFLHNHQSTDRVSLYTKIHGNNGPSLHALLANIYIAENINEALLLRKNLVVDESIVTKTGVWVGLNWLRLPADQEGYFGVLDREQEIKTIVTKLAEQEQHLSILESKLTKQENELAESLDEQTLLQKQIKEHEQIVRSKSNELSVATTRLQNLTTRIANIQTEINEYQTQIVTITEEIGNCRAELEHTIELMSKTANDKVILTNAKAELQNTLTNAEQRLHVCRESMHKLAISKHTLETQEQALLDAIKRLDKQIAVINERTLSINKALFEDGTPIASVKEELNKLLEQRMFVEEEMHAAKAELEGLDQTIATFEKDRILQEKLAQEIRSQLGELRMNWQTLKVRSQTTEETLTEMQVNIVEALRQLPTAANEPEWHNNAEKISKRIDRLGPINLAAVEEYKAEIERQKYLQSQYADLEEALKTLEQAISKIDRETRVKFKQTFEQINENFQQLFPKLFGGGQAYLEFTEDDLLETGIAVMARPPGKKNSTIHLLSGGEKALVAVALVFSIFQLNPAPFCMLDEVDAPLDDANINRYCNMLQEMSAKVQFIFITHNKLTMEIANQLAGVTMKEPGVSRLVSVDIDEAIEMAVA